MGRGVGEGGRGREEGWGRERGKGEGGGKRGGVARVRSETLSAGRGSESPV